jgi:hypothetical protein
MPKKETKAKTKPKTKQKQKQKQSQVQNVNVVVNNNKTTTRRKPTAKPTQPQIPQQQYGADIPRPSYLPSYFYRDPFNQPQAVNAVPSIQNTFNIPPPNIPQFNLPANNTTTNTTNTTNTNAPVYTYNIQSYRPYDEYDDYIPKRRETPIFSDAVPSSFSRDAQAPDVSFSSPRLSQPSFVFDEGPKPRNGKKTENSYNALPPPQQTPEMTFGTDRERFVEEQINREVELALKKVKSEPKSDFNALPPNFEREDTDQIYGPPTPKTIGSKFPDYNLEDTVANALNREFIEIPNDGNDNPEIVNILASEKKPATFGDVFESKPQVIPYEEDEDEDEKRRRGTPLPSDDEYDELVRGDEAYDEDDDDMINFDPPNKELYNTVNFKIDGNAVRFAYLKTDVPDGKTIKDVAKKIKYLPVVGNAKKWEFSGPLTPLTYNEAIGNVKPPADEDKYGTPKKKKTPNKSDKNPDPSPKPPFKVGRGTSKG